MANEDDKLAKVEVRHDGADLLLVFRGDWLLRQERPHFDSIEGSITAMGAKDTARLRFDVTAIGDWDTALLIFLRHSCVLARSKGLEFLLTELTEGMCEMLKMSVAVPREVQASESSEPGFFEAVGQRWLLVYTGIQNYCGFLGEFILDCGLFFAGRAQLRRKDFLSLLQSTGPLALGIICLLSFLMGLIIAFIGVIQLEKFGADVYVADLVGLVMTRELAPVMVGVIMAGRTGAAFAAQIGSMQVNEEVDALTCFGISPMQFLVLPRVFALILMMPLLCVFADLVSIGGGMLVAVSISDLTPLQFINQVKEAVGLPDFFGGVFKSVVFGVIVALAGCYRGLNCGRDASSVGLAATSAVVTGITCLVIADALFAVVFNILGI